jgi:large subunit ribosomal protein L21
MYAVVEAGGRQYQLTSGRFVDVDMVAGEPQSEYVFDKVVMLVNGKESVIGKPLVAGAKVKGKIIAHGKDKKIVIYHYRTKKGTRKRHGHRQHYTRIYIDSIYLNDKVLSEAKDTGKPQPKKESAPKATKAEKPAAKKAAAEPGEKKAATKKAAPKSEPAKSAKTSSKKEK